MGDGAGDAGHGDAGGGGGATPDLALLAAADVVAVYRLVEQLCDRGTDPQAWRGHLVAELGRAFAGAMAISYLAKFTLDPADIAPKTLAYADHGLNAAWRAYMARADLTADPVTPFIMERFGTDFTVDRREWVSDAAWQASPFYAAVAEPSGYAHAIFSQVGITRPGVVDCIGVARPAGAAPFTPADVAKVRLLHQELARLWRKFDPLDADRMPPRQRQVLDGLRRGQSRKQIAAALGVSGHTVHAYEKAIFARAQVSGRGELLAVMSQLVRPSLVP